LRRARRPQRVPLSRRWSWSSTRRRSTR
jgi:hypothetical protein